MSRLNPIGVDGVAATETAHLVSEPRVICTLGMHRSGTSLVSRMLNLLGVHLGTDRSLSGSGEDNPKGYWEHLPLSQLNDEILAEFGGRWDDPPAFPSSWSRDPRLGKLKEKARQVLTADFGAESLWGWKDPRTCLTIPFWQDLIEPIRYVLCVRNPCSVVASLGWRNGMSREKAERLWLTHVQSSLAHTSGRPRMFVFYEDIINDWAPDLRRLAAFIGRPERGDDPHVRASVGEFVEKELCHHRMSLEGLAGTQQISFATKGLYSALRGHAPRDVPTVEAFDRDRNGHSIQIALDLLGSDALETWDRSVAMIVERDTLACGLRAQTAAAAALDAERQTMATEIGALNETIAALSTESRALAVRHQGVVESMATLQSTFREVSLERETRSRESEAARQELQEIHTSCAWTLVTFCRRLIVSHLPAGTRRRRFFDAVVREMARRADADHHS